jgi:hypothetical protein
MTPPRCYECSRLQAPAWRSTAGEGLEICGARRLQHTKLVLAGGSTPARLMKTQRHQAASSSAPLEIFCWTGRRSESTVRAMAIALPLRAAATSRSKRSLTPFTAPHMAADAQAPAHAARGARP